MEKMRKTLPHILRSGGIFLLVFGIAVFALFFLRDQRSGKPQKPTVQLPAEIFPPVETEETDPPATEEAHKDSPVTSVVGIFVTEKLPREFAEVDKAVFSPIDLPFYLPEEYSLREKTVQVLTRIKGEDDSQDYAALDYKTIPRLAVETYMGYLLFDDGSMILLCSSDGTPMFRYSPGEYEPAYERDRAGNPLFVHYIDELRKVYYTVTEGGFSESDYDPATDGRKLKFDYPAGYGKESEYSVVTKDNERGALCGVNKSGEPLFSPHTAYYNEHGQYVDEYYLPPLTDGVESIGFYHFDHGYTRVRRQVIDHYHYFGLGEIKVVSDSDILVSKSGKVFPLPSGYSLAGYSEGMLLLEKNGAYGFVNLTGEWIAQPIFTDATPFIGGFATLTTPDGKVGMIDREGNVILPFAYRSISVNSAGIIAIYSDTYGWEIFKVNNYER